MIDNYILINYYKLYSYAKLGMHLSPYCCEYKFHCFSISMIHWNRWIHSSLSHWSPTMCIGQLKICLKNEHCREKFDPERLLVDFLSTLILELPIFQLACHLSAICQPFVSHLSAICQPLVSHLSAICQPLVSHLSAIGQPFVSHWSAICQPFVSHLSAIGQPFVSHFL